ncbi:MAG: hypothetical protein JWM52_629 [Candidatus Saccharibacteria bacterium]|nr:hypothetical protein [Candidatus Saccharibacteria bacterium]
MLKYIRGCILCLTILFGCAYVTPTYAASASLVLTQIQAGGMTGALQELVVIYNNSDENVDVTNWCLRNKSSVEYACFTKGNDSEVLILPSHMFATVASSFEVSATGFSAFTIVYSSTNQSSGSIVGSNDSISLIDSNKMIVDNHSWTSSITSGMLFARQIQTQTPLVFTDTDQAGDWYIQSPQFIPENGLRRMMMTIDYCLNIEGDQEVVPDNMVQNELGECHALLPPSIFLPIQITEVLPNAAGSDIGSEFIELYNPNNKAIDISAYTLWYGPEFEKATHFPIGSTISAQSYLSFSNTDLEFSLLNTSSRVRITNEMGTIDTETPMYMSPKDGVAWAFINDIWQYTNMPTPGAANLASIVDVDEEEIITQTPCATNQYRNTETNRCRLIVANVGTVTPCKDNQYRSEETNRCRNIVSSDTAQASCKEGQERNPDTNRCRTIKSVSKADYGVLGVQSSNSSGDSALWVTIIAIVVLALVYTIWEWRYEIFKLLRRFKHFVRVHK